jgi:hypothetical protein
VSVAPVPNQSRPVSFSFNRNDGRDSESLGTIRFKNAEEAAALDRQIRALIANAKEEQWMPEKPKE